ncbi:gamma-glutamyl hydrolase [Achlya hypogyna]|uniref:folate gamma-glutamyl hydrolase n=1 Tax=Achlya hypogyna TaxID=1202772 RepID=A0A1V9YGX5_ACHHY|nr:gamma-glutamyl hydrolase [Achlya hypogyna]
MADAVRLPILQRLPPPARPLHARRMAAGAVLLAVALLAVTMPWTSSVVRTAPVALGAQRKVLTAYPVIGVFSHPLSHPEKNGVHEYIAASYIKWIESAGGRAVRIPFTASEDELRTTLAHVNGLLFPGGDPSPNAQAKFLLDTAIELNNNGTYFPVWGTCLGFEWLVQLTAQDNDVLDATDAQNISSVLDLTPEASSSRLWSFSSYFHALTTAPRSANFHHFGITAEHFAATPSLSAFFTALATSTDRQGIPYVAAIEAKGYPFYGVQFHPEKNPYEYGRQANGVLFGDIDHSYEALLASQAFAHFFIGEARKNDHRFPTAADEFANVLYNHLTTAALYPGFESVYIFDPAPN